MNEELIKDAGKEIKAAFQAIAEQIGVGVDHFWPVFVRQQVVEGVFALIGMFIVIAIYATLLRMFIKKPKCILDGNDRISEGYQVIMGVTALILIPALLSTGMTCMKLFNPEYYALQAVMDLVK